MDDYEQLLLFKWLLTPPSLQPEAAIAMPKACHQMTIRFAVYENAEKAFKCQQ